MTTSVLYVEINANDSIAELGNPLRPFTILGAFNFLNSITSSATFTFLIGKGDFLIGAKCSTNAPNANTSSLQNESLIMSNKNLQIYGTGPKTTLLRFGNVLLQSDSNLTIASVGLVACQNVNVNATFNVLESKLTITGCILESRGVIPFENSNGVINITASSLRFYNPPLRRGNPVINAGIGNLILTNSQIYFDFSTDFFQKQNGSTRIWYGLMGAPSDVGSFVTTAISLIVNLNTDLDLVGFLNVDRVTLANLIVGHRSQNNSTDSSSSNNDRFGRFILLGYTDLPVASTPVDCPPSSTNTNNLCPLRNETTFYAINIVTSVTGLAGVYTMTNPTGAIVRTENISWNGVPTNPGIYTFNTSPNPVSNTIPNIPIQNMQPSNQQQNLPSLNPNIPMQNSNFQPNPLNQNTPMQNFQQNQLNSMQNSNFQQIPLNQNLQTLNPMQNSNFQPNPLNQNINPSFGSNFSPNAFQSPNFNQPMPQNISPNYDPQSFNPNQQINQNYIPTSNQNYNPQTNPNYGPPFMNSNLNGVNPNGGLNYNNLTDPYSMNQGFS